MRQPYRDLLHETGSIFVQIGDENVHRVRALMDEVFGKQNAAAIILVKKKGSQKGGGIESINDYILYYCKNNKHVKYKQLYQEFEDESEIARDFNQTRSLGEEDISLAKLAIRDDVGTYYKVKPLAIEKKYEGRYLFTSENITAGGERANQSHKFEFQGRTFDPGLAKGNCWKHTAVSKDDAFSGMQRLAVANRLYVGKDQIRYVRYFKDFGRQPISNWWSGFGGAKDPTYVVQTNEDVVARCLLMATDPGDLVIDPTCGSGTTAYVAEQWGRRWITIDTSRVAMALARARIMGARYPFYLLADSIEGAEKIASIARTDLPDDYASKFYSGNVRQGFVLERVPHITSALFANNSEIDVIYKTFQKSLEPLRNELNKALKKEWEEWDIPREADDDWPKAANEAHARWWEQLILRQKEIDASIAAKADSEYLYDKPYEDNKKVRVAGPFTVESLSPHRVLGVDENDELIDPLDQMAEAASAAGGSVDSGDPFVKMVLENLKTAGVQQADKSGKIDFTAVKPWPGKYIGAEAHYEEGKNAKQKRAGILIGPEFGTVSRQDLVYAAREAGDAGFNVLIACGFNYEAQASEFNKLGNLPILKARMNADLHMADDLKNTGKGNLFVIFGEPDIDLLPPEDAPQPKKGEKADLSPYTTMRVRINGVDVFQPSTGKVVSSEPDDIACWFIDTDYNGESFFVRHAYFLGASDPYKSLKTTLKAEINAEAWESLHSDVSRDFNKPEGGRIAVKVINHLGDEVMKVFRVE